MQKDRQDLNPVDRVMWCVDRALRGMGYPGFKTQMFLWLSERADAAALRRGIALLSRRHGVIAARLKESDRRDDAEVYWQLQPGAICPLHETDLASDDREAVLRYAGSLLSEVNDPTQCDPIEFHLLHRPGGRDVFLMQYNHMLMDNGPAAQVARQIDAFSQAADDAIAPAPEPPAAVRQYLRRTPYPRRRVAAKEALHLQARVMRGRAAVLRTPQTNATTSVALRIATRSLSPRETDRVRAKVVEICGFPSVSMTVLASAFRAIASLAPGDRSAGGNFVAGIGLDLGLRNGEGPLFQNLLSVLTISAQGEHLAVRDELIRMLSGQMRERLASRLDLGTLQLASAYSRRPRYIRWVVEHLLRYATSMWYAYFGAADAVGERFCGAGVDEVFYAGPTWSPVGVTLLVNQFRGRLLFQATYDPRLVPPELAEQFLDFVVDDLPK